jgi:hypothetical protein
MRWNFFFEVETCDSIDEEHTEDQWILFSAQAIQEKVKFIVIVPKVCEQDAKKELHF